MVPEKGLHDYEAGCLTLLLEMGVASEQALQEAQNRVAQAVLNEMNERRERRRALGLTNNEFTDPWSAG
jgi:hypothetical protein